jgi:hypothetical protein
MMTSMLAKPMAALIFILSVPLLKVPLSGRQAWHDYAGPACGVDHDVLIPP